MKNEVFLGLGSNQGNRGDQLVAARDCLQGLLGPPVRTSAVYRTAAWGETAQPDFFNQVLSFQLETGREDWLLQQLLEIETGQGRVRTEKWGARAIDLDILLAGTQTIRTSRLCIPHPFLHLRRFVLVPLCEIAPDQLHPVLNKTVSELLAVCPDKLAVNVIRPPEA